MNYILTFFAFLNLITGFSQLQLNQQQAERLIALPLKCAQQEFPNKLGQVLNDSTELKSPSELHPAFYGCFDWHSSVHGHWLMVTLVKEFPGLPQAETAKRILFDQLSASNIQAEIAFFNTTNNGSFERLYGWAWILKLQQELDTWNDTLGKRCAQNLQPLTDLLCTKYESFLPKLVYPIRSGEHTNTAFGLSFAYDYAVHANRVSLKTAIEIRSIHFYGNDTNYNLTFEPSGYDFLSPAFEEINLMGKILTPNTYQKWLKRFLPAIFSTKFQLEPGKVLDRTDGKLVHLDGLNFSRAWCLNAMIQKNSKLSHLKPIADAHLKMSLPNIVDGDYMGEHWLASFALVALLSNKELSVNE